ncbi:MAG: PAS domain S-box protein [Flavobacteriaceae bacterium]
MTGISHSLQAAADLISARPAWVWDPSEHRADNANAAAAALFGVADIEALEGRRFEAGSRLARQCDAIAGSRIRGRQPGIERIRVIQGVRDVAVTVQCTPRDNGTIAFQVLDTGQFRVPPPARRVAMAKKALPTDLILIDGSGTVLRDSPFKDDEVGKLARDFLADGKIATTRDGWQLTRLEIGDGPLVAARRERAAGAATLEASDNPPRELKSVSAGPVAETGRGGDPLFGLRYRLLIDLDGIVSDADPALSTLLGYAGGDIAGVDLTQVCETRDDALANALAAGRAFRDVPAVWTGPASTRGFIFSGAPVYDEDLELAGYRAHATGGVEISDDASPEKEVAVAEADEAFIAAARAILADEDGDAEDDDALTGGVAPVVGDEEQQARLLPHEAQAFQAIGRALAGDDADYRAGGPVAAAADEPGVDDEADQPETGIDATPSEDVPLPPEAATQQTGEPALSDLEFIPPEDEVGSHTGESRAAGKDEERRLLDEVSDGIIVFRDETILRANRPLLEMFGYPDAAAIEHAGGVGALFAERLDLAAERGRRLVGVTRGGDSFPIDARLRRVTSGGRAAMAYFVRPIAAPAETAAAESISQQIDATSEIAELRAILDTATEGVVVLDSEGRIERLNQSAEALFGHDSHAVTGRAFTTLIAPESRDSVQDYLEGLKRNGVASILNDGREITGRVAQGGALPLFLTIGRLGDGPQTKFCAVIRDITQWKKAEGELVEARRKAETLSAQKSEFLAKISHEIRTPLNAIIGFSEVMIEERFGPIGNERYRGYIHDIRTSGDHVLSLINDLLDLSKVEAGHMELEFGSVLLNDIVEQSVAIMQPQANKERILIRTNLTLDLPPVVADQRSMRQILLNLLSNAVKFTPPGGQIIVSTIHTADGDVLLRVRDTGVGMNETDIRTAMEPFRQVGQNRLNANRGTGLGLPLTKALVEANRASFGIESKVDHGTLIEVSFPQNRVLAE